MHFRYTGNGITESWVSLEQAVKNQWLHTIAGDKTFNKITEINGRFEFYVEV